MLPTGAKMITNKSLLKRSHQRVPKRALNSHNVTMKQGMLHCRWVLHPVISENILQPRQTDDSARKTFVWLLLAHLWDHAPAQRRQKLPNLSDADVKLSLSLLHSPTEESNWSKWFPTGQV